MSVDDQEIPFDPVLKVREERSLYTSADIASGFVKDGVYRGFWAHPLVSRLRGQTSEHWFPPAMVGSACRRHTAPRGAAQVMPHLSRWNAPCQACRAKWEKLYGKLRLVCSHSGLHYANECPRPEVQG